MKSCIFVAGIFAILLQSVLCLVNVADFCFQCKQRRNQKDLYANPEDCHAYIQCFYIDDYTATGYVRRCATGTYWNDTLLTCVQEGYEACSSHPCQDPRIAGLGKYQLNGQSCNSFFICSFNETRCCDPEQRFNPITGDCDFDVTCQDYCQSEPAPQSDVTQLGDNSCLDNYGNMLTAQDDPNTFILGRVTFNCAKGTQFDLETCQCSTLVDIGLPGGSSKLCQLWLPFDQDLNDYSAERFHTTAYDGASFDGSVWARGTGSLKVIGNNSRLSIPGMKTLDIGSLHPEGQASWCYFFRCENNANSFECTQSGGILSNNKDETFSEFSFVAAGVPGKQVETRLGTSSHPGPFQVPVANGWNQVCTIWSGSQVNTYVNSILQSTVQLGSIDSLTIGHCPYVVGSDQFYGGLVGHIDEVLICSHALSIDQIQAHFHGDHETLRKGGLIPKN